jgi:hypothetical protein
VKGNQYVTFMGAYEIFYFIDEKFETCAMASKVTKTTSYLVNYRHVLLDNHPCATIAANSCEDIDNDIVVGHDDTLIH